MPEVLHGEEGKVFGEVLGIGPNNRKEDGGREHRWIIGVRAVAGSFRVVPAAHPVIAPVLLTTLEASSEQRGEDQRARLLVRCPIREPPGGRGRSQLLGSSQ
jgi:hypothetical protein